MYLKIEKKNIPVFLHYFSQLQQIIMIFLMRLSVNVAIFLHFFGHVKAAKKCKWIWCSQVKGYNLFCQFWVPGDIFANPNTSPKIKKLLNGFKFSDYLFYFTKSVSEYGKISNTWSTKRLESQKKIKKLVLFRPDYSNISLLQLIKKKYFKSKFVQLFLPNDHHTTPSRTLKLVIQTGKQKHLKIILYRLINISYGEHKKSL